MEPTIPWAEIRGIGNRLRHEYDTVDPVRIWRVVHRDLAGYTTFASRQKVSASIPLVKRSI